MRYVQPSKFSDFWSVMLAVVLVTLRLCSLILVCALMTLVYSAPNISVAALKWLLLILLLVLLRMQLALSAYSALTVRLLAKQGLRSLLLSMVTLLAFAACALILLTRMV